MKSLDFRSSSDKLLADEDPGHRAPSSERLEVVLYRITITCIRIIIIGSFLFHMVRRDKMVFVLLAVSAPLLSSASHSHSCVIVKGMTTNVPSYSSYSSVTWLLGYLDGNEGV